MNSRSLYEAMLQTNSKVNIYLLHTDIDGKQRVKNANPS